MVEIRLEVRAKVTNVSPRKVIKRLKRKDARRLLCDRICVETYRAPSITRWEGAGDCAIVNRVLAQFSESIGSGWHANPGMSIRLELHGKDEYLVVEHHIGEVNGLESIRRLQVRIRRRHRACVRRALNQLGLRKTTHHEAKRVCYELSELGVMFVLYRLPGIAPYVEIASGDDQSTVHGARLIGFKRRELLALSREQLCLSYGLSPTYLGFRKDQVTVRIAEALDAMKRVLIGRGHCGAEAGFIAAHYLEGELAGKSAHGIAKFCWDLQFYPERQGCPQIVVEREPMILIDGNGEIGPLAARFAVNLAIQRARRGGLAVVCMRNAQAYGVLSTWTRTIAKAGLIGIVSNSSAPFTAPHGGASAVLGTNPLSTGFPSSDQPLVFDAAMSKAPMSLKWYNQERALKLPPKTFLDKEGRYTDDPLRARCVEIFGGAKGYGISLALQVLTNIFIPPSRKTSNDMGGMYVQAIDPSIFQPLQDFIQRNDELIRQIKSTAARKGVKRVRLPGDASKRKTHRATRLGVIRVAATVWEGLQIL